MQPTPTKRRNPTKQKPNRTSHSQKPKTQHNRQSTLAMLRNEHLEQTHRTSRQTIQKTSRPMTKPQIQHDTAIITHSLQHTKTITRLAQRLTQLGYKCSIEIDQDEDKATLQAQIPRYIQRQIQLGERHAI